LYLATQTKCDATCLTGRQAPTPHIGGTLAIIIKENIK